MTARALRIGLVASLAVATTSGLACERRAPAPSQAATPNPPPPAAPPPTAAAKPDAAAPTKPRPTFTLIYSSDLHGRVSPRQAPLNLPPGVGMQPLAKREAWAGLGRRATIVDRARVGSGGVVQVDAGDFLPRTDDPRDEAAIDPDHLAPWISLVLASYRRLGIDAVTLGDREIGAFREVKAVAKAFQAGHVPVVLANLVDGKDKPLFPASVLVDAGGIKVGIFGVAELGDSTRDRLRAQGYTVAPAVDAASAAARDLRARGAQFVVALVNASAGRARAAEIAAAAGDVDVAVLALGGGAGLPDGGATGGDAPTAGASGAARPRLLTAAGDLVVGRLDVGLAGGQPPVLDDAVVELTKAVPEQLGVGLLSRLARIPLKDTEKMEAEAKRKHVELKLRDLYEIWDYGSTNACEYCHPKAVAQWKTTDHAHAFATLVKAKRDRDPACLGCHTVGFLQPGGTRDMPMARGQFATVGCEGCHGPSAAHVRAIDHKQGTVRAVDAVVCLGCHTPDQNVGPFDPVAAMKEILGPGHGAPGAPDAPGGQIPGH
jgi:hypothetical protein